ncbi:MAG: thiamine-phosphate kinase [Actinomycetia bacterium]|nr:thiamine-phosphate kinase [Actinomycetes bacterium]MCH9799905.1 thiamine-phosphate kinase [Actinomycetes bacterium]
MAETVADIGEFGLIELIRQRVPVGDAQLGIGDDAAVLSQPGSTLASVDTLVADRHFKPEWCSGADVGHRAAAAGLADIAAMGGQPSALLVSLSMPSDTEVSWALELLDGLVAEAQVARAQVVGGDLCQSETTTVSVTALGRAERPVTRAGARPGDVLAIAGRQGWAAAGLTVLSRGFRSPRALVEAYQRPHPPYDSGPQAAAAGATAMIDISDGLLADVRHLAVESSAVAELDSQAVPVADQLRETSSAFNVDPLMWVMAGGDDHSLVAAFPPGVALPELFIPIGRITEVVSGEPGVTVDGRHWSGRGGHDHFR